MNDPIHFRRISEGDLPMLSEWLRRPHVAAWWDVQTSLEAVRTKYLPRLAEDSTVVPYIAFQADEPIGYIQSYVAACCGDGWWPDITDTGVVGIDQFLADGAKLGQGLGSAMAAAFVKILLADPGVTLIQTDPSPGNARAIRCYEKAGFREVGLVATPDGEALLMVIRRAAPASLLGVVRRWAGLREDVLGLAVVGSHARGDARPDSDVDLVLVYREPSRLLVDTAWVSTFGEAHEVCREDWGLIQSVRVVYQDGLEVEFGVTGIAWTETPPDGTTAAVVRGGCSILLDRDGSLGRLKACVEDSG